MPHETRQSAVEQLRGVDRTNRTVDIVASTFDIDSYGTRIDQNGWDLTRFKQNPVICLQHDSYGYSGSNGLPVAKAIPETIRVENQKLVMRLQFPEEGKFPLADQVFNLVADGFLSGISVGFNPTEWEDTTEKSQDGTETTVRVYRQQELLETSIVTIPSNDAALVQRAEVRNADVKLIRRMTEQLEQTIKAEAPKFEGRTLGNLTINVRVTDLEAFTELEQEIAKCRTYFENKQPANRESTKVLERFFKKILKEEPPANEVKAWQRMDATIEAMEEAEEKGESAAEEAATEIDKSPVPPAEAPHTEEAPPERSVSLSQLKAMPKALVDAMENAVAEAARRGVPRSDFLKVKQEAGEQYFLSLSNS